MSRMETPTTIAIVDDDEAVCDSLDVLLRASGHDTETYLTAGAFLGANLDSVRCVLLDVRLPDGDGISVLQQLMEQKFRPPVIIITGHGDVPMAVRAMRLGALDFVEKPFDPDVLLQTIDRAIKQFEAAEREAHAASDATGKIARLSPREHEVMCHLVRGQPNKVIAHELGLSPRTVEVHRARVMEKTAAGSLSELVRLAIAAGVDLDEVK